MSVRTPATVYEELKSAYLRYVDTAYWLRDPQLMKERRTLLESGGALFTDVLLEPVLPYDATVDLDQAATEAGLSSQAANLVGQALFGAFTPEGEKLKLRKHQAEALVGSLQPGVSDGRNIVVTSGTGSGKTEAFLLPVLCRLVEESLKKPADPPAIQWWEGSKPRWQSSRGSAQRTPAMRALVLYPTNALVEDQITRLRRTLRELAAAEPRASLWFGRYTGSTLGSGVLPKVDKQDPRVDDVGGQVRDLVREYDRLREAKVSEELLSQFSDPRRSEMLTRWDMVAAPPDILVTNYSMLNAMLMRELEEPLFEQTRTWLQRPDAVFTLVVDELHLYRGTSGSEVAMIIRNLLMRLGLEPDSPKLRCIATSASLDQSEKGPSYLEAFFGIDRGSFRVTAGKPRSLGAKLPLSKADLLKAAATPGDARIPTLQKIARDIQLSEAVAEACRTKSGKVRATKLPQVAERLFAEQDHDGEGMRIALEALEHLEGDPASISFRAHMFARTMRGLWACSNPNCDQVSRPVADTPIGKLFPIPTSTCLCGGRVLELLYCYECGDLSLGGFVASVEGVARLLTSSPLDIPAATNDFIFRRSAEKYAWYRPGKLTNTDTWSHVAPGGQNVKFGFAGATWNPFLGALQPAIGGDSTGVVLVSGGLKPDSGFRTPALPERCPRCNLTTGRQEGHKFFRGTVRSAIRAHTSGLSQASQLLLSQLHRSMGTTAQDSRTILFTDSRDDAAKTAVGVERNHFRDLVRQLVRKQASTPKGDLTEILARGAENQDLLTPEELKAYNEVLAERPPLVMAYMKRSIGRASETDTNLIEAFESEQLATQGRLRWSLLLHRTTEDLVGLVP